MTKDFKFPPHPYLLPPGEKERKKSGFLLEFTLAKVGAGMTNKRRTGKKRETIFSQIGKVKIGDGKEKAGI